MMGFLTVSKDALRTKEDTKKSKQKKDGYIISEKVIRQIMVEGNLVAKQVCKKKYSSHTAVPNVIKRDFKANNPNEKGLTAITEFKIPRGKIYLSPIVDCFDG